MEGINSGQPKIQEGFTGQTPHHSTAQAKKHNFFKGFRKLSKFI
jgi:hypothetical protein